MFAKGTPVRQVVKPIEGVVTGVRADEDAGVLMYHVEFDKDGEKHGVWFTESQIVKTGEAPGKATAGTITATATQKKGA